jgi:hypothetical protein
MIQSNMKRKECFDSNGTEKEFSWRSHARRTENPTSWRLFRLHVGTDGLPFPQFIEKLNGPCFASQ